MKQKEIPNNLFFAEVERQLNETGSVTIPMRGVSMHPLLREGRDAVILRPAACDNLKKWDVVLFRHNGRHILHRYLGLHGNQLCFRGDNLPGPGERCSADNVVAVVSHVIRYDSVSISVASLKWCLAFRIWLLIRPLVLILRKIKKPHVLTKVIKSYPCVSIRNNR